MKSETNFPDTRGSLLVQLKSREQSEAWRQFVEIYRPVIYRMARKRGLQDADAQDLSQQVLISISAAIERWEQRDESIRFRHWLRRVAKNAITNALTRRPKDQAGGGTEFQNRLQDSPQADEQLENELTQEHRRELFHKAATIVQSEVAAESWKVFQLCLIDGLTIEQAASQVNKTVGAAYACRGRIMNRLRSTVQILEQQL